MSEPTTFSNVPLEANALDAPSPTPSAASATTIADLPVVPAKPERQRLVTWADWAGQAYQYTVQVIKERYGAPKRTVDEDLATRIETLKVTQKKLTAILGQSELLTQQICAFVSTCETFGNQMHLLGMQSLELAEEWERNASVQLSIFKNGQVLHGALTHFNGNLATLTGCTMEDTVQAIDAYEKARIAHDACLNELEALSQKPPTPYFNAIKTQYEEMKDALARRRDSVIVKLTLLDENRVKVMRKQLLLLHNATAGFFSGNEAMLRAAVDSYHTHVSGGDTVATLASSPTIDRDTSEGDIALASHPR